MELAFKERRVDKDKTSVLNFCTEVIPRYRSFRTQHNNKAHTCIDVVQGHVVPQISVTSKQNCKSGFGHIVFWSHHAACARQALPASGFAGAE